MIIDKTNSIFLEGKEIVEIKNNEGNIIWKKQTTPAIPNYLRFDIPQRKVLGVFEGMIISFTNFSIVSEPQYSLDGINFQDFTSQIHIALDLNNPTTVYFRAKGITADWRNRNSFIIQADTWSRVLPEIEVRGDVRSLLSYDDFENATLTSNCFYGLFKDCTSIITAPELNATTLASECYSYMFKGCTKLTTAPELPATTLASSCYAEMFYGCSNLVTGPEIKATTLVTACFYEMFCNCTKLNYIKVHALSWNSVMANYWVDGVPSGGTFVKPAALTNIPNGDIRGIPSGWTVVNY